MERDEGAQREAEGGFQRLRGPLDPLSTRIPRTSLRPRTVGGIDYFCRFISSGKFRKGRADVAY